MSKVYFIIGASGSGKTACLASLKNLLPEFRIYDFDAIGVPENADKKWRQETTEKWMKKISNLSESSDVCLVGQMVPAEILCSPSAANMLEIHIVLLDCSDEIRIQRLKKRDSYGIDQNTLNWAAWLRMHCQDPSWEPQVIKENSASLMLFNRWETLTSWPNAIQINSLNTSFLTITQTAQSIAHIINSTIKKTQDNQIEMAFTEANRLDLDKIIPLLKDDPLGKYREQSLDEDKKTYFDAFEKIKSDENAKIIIGSHGNNIIAVAQINFIQNLTYQGGMRAQIEGVRVRQDYRSKGIGKLLFKHLISLSKERDCHLVQLTTDKARPAALNFYEGLGFKQSHVGLKLHLKEIGKAKND